jgi:hypothetical protein
MGVVLACQNHCMERAHESKTVEGKLYWLCTVFYVVVACIMALPSFGPASFRSALYTACGCTTSRT